MSTQKTIEMLTETAMAENLQPEINAYVAKLHEAARKAAEGEHREAPWQHEASDSACLLLQDQQADTSCAAAFLTIENNDCKELTLSPSDRIALDAQANRHKRQLQILSHAIHSFCNTDNKKKGNGNVLKSTRVHVC